MPKIGDALKRAVEIKPEEAAWQGKRGGVFSALMNPNRRKIFKFLCRHPCSGMRRICIDAGLSRPSVKWHLDVLSESGYIQEFIDGKKPVYCPAGLVSASNMHLFRLLAREDCASVYSHILAMPGGSSRDIRLGSRLSQAKVHNCMVSLIESGLATTVRDGRHTRYYPTGKLEQAAAEEKKVRKEFIRTLIARLDKEHMRPEVGGLKGPETVISISALGQKDSISIPNDACFDYMMADK